MAKEMDKPEYRNVRTDVSFKDVYKSPWLGALDFDSDGDTVVVLEKAWSATAKFEKGREEECVFGKFKGYDKDIVINTTNSKQIAKFANSPNLSDWVNIPLQVYVDQNIKGKAGEIVSGWRIRTKQPVIKKPDLTPDHPKFSGALESIRSGQTTVEAIRKYYNVSDEVAKLLETGEVA
jgi:hypothetical protein